MTQREYEVPEDAVLALRLQRMRGVVIILALSAVSYGSAAVLALTWVARLALIAGTTFLVAGGWYGVYAVRRVFRPRTMRVWLDGRELWVDEGGICEAWHLDDVSHVVRSEHGLLIAPVHTRFGAQIPSEVSGREELIRRLRAAGLAIHDRRPPRERRRWRERLRWPGRVLRKLLRLVR